MIDRPPPLLRALMPAAALLAAPPWAAQAAVGDPAARLRDPAQEERAERFGRELRCLVCQHQSIEDSDADLARDLRRLVREQGATTMLDETRDEARTVSDADGRP